MSIKNRINLICDAQNITLTQFSEQSGLNYRTLQNYMKGNRKPSFDFFSTLNEQMGISADWLLTGKGSMYVRHSTELMGEDEKSDESEFVLVDRLSAKTSGGLGAENPYVEDLEPVSYRRSYLKAQGIPESKAKVIKHVGDSMSPEFEEGDWLLVNLAEHEPVNGRVFCD